MPIIIVVITPKDVEQIFSVVMLDRVFNAIELGFPR